MSKMFVIAAVSIAGFSRCGVRFPHEGMPVQEDDFDELQWQKLIAEPNLHIKPVTEADAEEAERRMTMIAEVIEHLGPDGFTKDGKPNLALLNDKLEPEIGKVTSADRDAVMHVLERSGFKVPTKDT